MPQKSLKKLKPFLHSELNKFSILAESKRKKKYRIPEWRVRIDHEKHERILFVEECYSIQRSISEVYREMGYFFLEASLPGMHGEGVLSFWHTIYCPKDGFSPTEGRCSCGLKPRTSSRGFIPPEKSSHLLQLVVTWTVPAR